MPSGLMNKTPEAIATAPRMISGPLAWLASHRQATAPAISSTPKIAGVMRRPRLQRPGGKRG